MRFAFLVASALLTTGCVPDVTWLTDGGSPDATRDSPGMDGLGEAEADGSADAEDAADAKTDAPEFCQGDAGAPMGPGLKCCGSVVCSCTNTQACNNCAMTTCPWPLVCCNTGGPSTICKEYDGGC